MPRRVRLPLQRPPASSLLVSRNFRPSPLPLHPTSPFLTRQPGLSQSRFQSTSSTSDVPSTPPSPSAPPPSEREEDLDESRRTTATFYISNVFPVRFARWDPRPAWARFLREEALLERLHDIASDVTSHAFRIESWEVARKDGGVLLHVSYIPPASHHTTPGGGPEPPASTAPEATGEKGGASASAMEASPGKLFIPQLVESAKRHGGFPYWFGGWVGARLEARGGGLKGKAANVHDETSLEGLTRVGSEEGEREVKSDGTGLDRKQAVAGAGRVWTVRGREWTEDMDRYPTNRLRVEFDGPDVSQEMLYKLFRPYGRVADIVPPSPAPAGSLRFAQVGFSKISPAARAINCLHGFSTPTNTADYTLGSSTDKPIPLSRLRIYYERPLKAHAIRDWISAHPRIALPVLAFLIGTLSYTFFDPIRAFFVRSKLEGVWDLEKYSIIQYVRSKFSLSSFNFLHRGSAGSGETEDAIGEDAWRDRVEAEETVETWLKEYPSTVVTITGPPGSGKVSLVNRVLKKEDKPALVIDCAEVAKGKNDGQLVSALADQTGYYPVFSFLSSLNGLIDLASVGLIGQKAGFSTPVDQQLRGILEIVGSALRDVAEKNRNDHAQDVAHAKDRAGLLADRERRRQTIMRGGGHDGRLDCVAGNGVMSELGYGDEPELNDDLDVEPIPLLDDTAPIHGEAVPPTSASLPMAAAAIPGDAALDEESEYIKSLPIVVLKNFAQKTAKGDLWTVMAEWGASLIENRIAHVIVVTEGATASKALTKALPSKPLNTVSLADADRENSLAYVRDKLAGGGGGNGTGGEKGGHVLGADEAEQVGKLGGRMVDLETLVYKVKTGSTVQDAVDDIVRRNVVELRKAAFGDDSEDAKSLPWTRAQAWKIVSELAKHGQISYAKLLQEFPFKGAEQSLKAMEEHELVGVSYHEGRPGMVRPGKPVFRWAFEQLVKDPVFRATSQIEYNTTLIAKAEADIRSYETELSQLREITAENGGSALGVSEGGWLGLGKSSAVKERAKWLLDKMGKGVDKLEKLEKENEGMLRLLARADSLGMRIL